MSGATGLRAATWPRDRPDDERLMLVDANTGALVSARVATLVELLGPGDVLVVNDAATAPAAIRASTRRGEAIELRIYRAELPIVQAVALGDGEPYAPTEARGAPPALAAGEPIAIAPGVDLVVESAHHDGRLLDLRTTCAEETFFRALYAAGRPIQYAYVARPLSLYHVQTSFSSRPWAAEMPSAGRPLSWRTLGALRKKGVVVARLTHGAGISSTGSDALDRTFPLPERYDIPAATVEAVMRARSTGGRVIAAGTTVVRALESAALAGGGVVRAGRGDARLVLGPESERRMVDAVLTGIHEAGTSHHRLLGAFLPRALLDGALRLAENEAFTIHEFGDSMLVVGTPPRALPLGVTRSDRSASIAA